MTTDIVMRALEVSRRMQEATWGRHLQSAAREFVEVLELVPDYAPSELTADQIQLLRGLADQVIAQIEAHLAQGGYRPRIEQDLAAAVYAIRRALEEIDRWQRHYAGT